MENIVDFENFELNEALAITDKRGAKKVASTYAKFFEKFPALGKNAMGVPKVHHIGAVKALYNAAMIDANFGREAASTANAMKGRLFPIEVKVPELNNAIVKIPVSKMAALIEDNANAISGAAKWSGPAIVEGTAMYLDSIGNSKEAENLLAKFQAQF